MTEGSPLSNGTVSEFDLAAARRRWLREGYWGFPKLTTALDLAASERPHATAVVDPRGRSVTYAELREQVDRLAHGLRAAGLRKGDVVAVQLPNWIEYCVAHLAAVRAGMVTLFLHPAQRASELSFVFGKCRPQAVIFPSAYRNSDFLAMYDRLRAHHRVPLALAVGDAAAGALPSGISSYDDLLQASAPDAEDEPVELDDPQLVVFSSGTTAEPKGIRHSYGTADHGIHMWRRLLALTHEDVVFTPATLGHVGGAQWGLRTAILVGAKLVLMDRWNGQEAADVIRREGCTYSLVTPTFIEDILGAVGSGGLPSFRSWVVGGARIRPSLVPEAAEKGVGAVLRGFGMSEHFMSSLCRPYDSLEKRMHTDGRPLPGCAYAIVDPEDSSVLLTAGEVGELAYRGPALVDGYFTSETETAAAFVNGWQLTGDLAVLDEDGFMTVVDRKKDIIVRGGENISPLELENLLFRHARIAEVSVVRYPDPRLGERVCAVVVPEPGQTVTLDDLCGYLADCEIARYKFPERLEIRNELPRTSLGKVAKRVLERELAQEPLRVD